MLITKIIRRIKKEFQCWYSTIFTRLVFYLNDIEAEGFVKVCGNPFIINNGRMKLGKNISMSSGAFANPVNGAGRIIITVKKGAELIIGDNVGISNTEIYCATKIEICEGVLIGGGVRIYDTDFHSVNSEFRVMHPDPDIKSKPIIIRENSFIGSGTIILKGVSIGPESVIGAGSVVTKSVPKGEIWAGNPAKKIIEIVKH